jgi:hypothetical protein
VKRRAPPIGVGRPWLAALAAALLTTLAPSTAAVARPLDLSDSTPRAVCVELEDAPKEKPWALAARYGGPYEARLTGGDSPLQLKVTIPAAAFRRHMERQNVIGTKPRDPHEDFVWVFDTATGHVLSARVRSTVIQDLKLDARGAFGKTLGALLPRQRVVLHARMSTSPKSELTKVGYRPSSVAILGIPVAWACTNTDEEATDCRKAQPYPLQRGSGCVNAVGRMSASVGDDTYAPMGEAIFSEQMDGACRPSRARVERLCPTSAVPQSGADGPRQSSTADPPSSGAESAPP